MPTVYDALRARFGGATEQLANPEVAQSTNADAILLREDARRVEFILCNLSVNPIFIRPEGVASAAAGILCPANTVTSIGFPDDGHMAALEWHVVSPAGNSAMTYYAIRFTEQAAAPLAGWPQP